MRIKKGMNSMCSNHYANVNLNWFFMRRLRGRERESSVAGSRTLSVGSLLGLLKRSFSLISFSLCTYFPSLLYTLCSRSFVEPTPGYSSASVNWDTFIVFFRMFGSSGYCSACNKEIQPYEFVMRSAKPNLVFHLNCFSCSL